MKPTACRKGRKMVKKKEKLNIPRLLYLAVLLAGFFMCKIGFGEHIAWNIETMIQQYGLPVLTIICVVSVLFVKKRVTSFLLIFLTSVAGTAFFGGFLITVFALFFNLWLLKFYHQADRLFLVILIFGVVISVMSAAFLIKKQLLGASLIPLRQDVILVVVFFAVISLLFFGYALINKTSLRQPVGDCRKPIAVVLLWNIVVVVFSVMFICNATVPAILRRQVFTLWICLSPFIIYDWYTTVKFKKRAENDNLCD